MSGLPAGAATPQQSLRWSNSTEFPPLRFEHSVTLHFSALGGEGGGRGKLYCIKGVLIDASLPATLHALPSHKLIMIYLHNKHSSMILN